MALFTFARRMGAEPSPVPKPFKRRPPILSTWSCFYFASPNGLCCRLESEVKIECTGPSILYVLGIWPGIGLVENRLSDGHGGAVKFLEEKEINRSRIAYLANEHISLCMLLSLVLQAVAVQLPHYRRGYTIPIPSGYGLTAHDTIRFCPILWPLNIEHLVNTLLARENTLPSWYLVTFNTVKCLLLVFLCVLFFCVHCFF